MYGEWVKCTDREPYLSDRSVLMHFANGSIETVHVEDFFKPISNGIKDGVQQWTKWYINHDPACTHWMELPDAPGNAQQQVQPDNGYCNPETGEPFRYTPLQVN